MNKNALFGKSCGCWHELLSSYRHLTSTAFRVSALFLSCPSPAEAAELSIEKHIHPESGGTVAFRRLGEGHRHTEGRSRLHIMKVPNPAGKGSGTFPIGVDVGALGAGTSAFQANNHCVHV